MMRKICLFANTDWYLYNFRLDFARALKLAGFDVLLVSPDGPYRKRIEEMGFRWLPIPVSRRGINPVNEIRVLLQILHLYREEKPDIVHHFTIKCVFYGSTAAHLAGIKKIVNSITGMGYVFTGGGLKKSLLRFLAVNWYRLVLNGTRVIFQNRDDQAYFLEEGIIGPKEAVFIAGSGVNIERFLPSTALKVGAPLVVLASRMLYDKGIGEYVEAARRIRQMGVNARFVLIGNIDTGNPSAIPLSQIEAWHQEGCIEWWGWREDMPEVYRQADIACLPSYREGLPKMLIEAGACGLPCVTTDFAGCREVVRNEENGLLVRPRDVESLVAALRRLLLDDSLRKKMGKRSREIVEEQFGLSVIIEKTLQVYEELVPGEHGS